MEAGDSITTSFFMITVTVRLAISVLLIYDWAFVAALWRGIMDNLLCPPVLVVVVDFLRAQLFI